MEYYEVVLGVTLDAYKAVRIKARSKREAERLARRALDALADDETQGQFEADWSTCRDMRVLPDSAIKEGGEACNDNSIFG